MSTDLSELTCPDCGARDQREAFCDSCGAALSRAKAPAAAPAAPAPSVPAQGSVPAEESITAPAASSTSASRSAEEAMSNTDSSAPAAAPGSSSHPADDGSDTAELAEIAQAEAARVASAKAAAESASRARALLVPVADQSAPAGIAPVLPGRPDPIAPQRKGAENLDDLDAGIQCQWCGTRNPPERHFCRRCGQRMAYAPVEARRPSWWRRLIFFWRNRPLPFAGQRPRLRRGPGQAVRPLIWGVVLVGLIVVVVKEYTPASENVRDHFAKPNEVSNWTVTSSHQDPNHQPKLLHDTYSDTWWGSGFSTQNTNGVSVTVNFTQPVNLLDLGITPGAGTAADTFGMQGSPETVQAELIPIPGKGEPIRSTFTLDDQPGFQKFQLRGDDIAQVVLTVTSSYPATSPTADPAKTETAISELEFYTRH